MDPAPSSDKEAPDDRENYAHSTLTDQPSEDPAAVVQRDGPPLHDLVDASAEGTGPSPQSVVPVAWTGRYE